MANATAPAQGGRAAGPTWAVILLIAATAAAVGWTGGTSVTGAAANAGGPRDLPTLPEGFPDASQRYLPDVTVSAIEAWITSNDYECTREPQEIDDPVAGKEWLYCHAPLEHRAFNASVALEYDDDDRVRLVEATCERGAQTSEEYCPSVFIRTVENVFAGHPESRKARRWTRRNIPSDDATVIGGIQLKGDVERHRLEIRPES
jgi:hypothetical protein